MYRDHTARQGPTPEKSCKIHMDIFVKAGFAEESFRRFISGYPNIHRCCQIYSNYNYCMDICLRQKADIPVFLGLLQTSIPKIDHIQWYIISDVLKPIRRKRA